MPRNIALVITADGREVEAKFDQLEKRADRLQSKLKARPDGLSPGDVRALEMFARAQTSVASRAEREQIRSFEHVSREYERNAQLQTRAIERASRDRERISQREAIAHQRASQEAAQGSSSSFSNLLGASFFANLGARAVSALLGELQALPGEATKIAVETQNALKGLESIALFKGIDQKDAQDAVMNLRFVRGGIISVAEASTTLKNLLLTGFSLPQAIALMERFSDASAFGKQQALSYGEAIRSASEGIKNQNSILVDNVGITKNLSVILQERGFVIQDLSDKVKGAAAREALYQGLLQESQAQVGDADKVMAGYTGTIAAQDIAYQNLQRAVGDVIIQNPVWLESIKITTEQINNQTTALRKEGSAAGQFAEDMTDMYARIKAYAIPFTYFIVKSSEAAVKSVLLLVEGAVGAVATTLEAVFQTTTGTIASLVNYAIDQINTLTENARKLGPLAALLMPGAGPLIQQIPTIPRVNLPEHPLGANQVWDNFRRTWGELNTISGELDKIVNEGQQITRRLDEARARRERMRGGQPELRAQIDALGPAELRGATDAVATANAAGGAGGRSQGAARAREDAYDALRDIKDVAAAFKAAFGSSLPYRSGQTSFHTAQGWDHTRAADIQLNPNTPQGRWLEQYLTAQGIPHRAFAEATRNAAGRLIATGPHIHMGEPSLRFGAARPARQRGIDDDLISLVLGGQLAADPLTGAPLFNRAPIGGTLMMRSQAQFEQAVAPLMRARAMQPVETTPTDLSSFRVEEHLTKAQRERQEMEKKYLGQGGEYEKLINRRQNLAVEVENVWRQAIVDRGNHEMDTLVELERAEAHLYNLRVENADSQFVEQRRLLKARNEQLDLEQRIIDIQDEWATGPYNAALRQQLTYLEAIRDVRRRDEEAINSQIRSQVELADQSVLHTERVRASVLEHFAQQRSMSDAVADSFVSVADRAGDAVQRALGKIDELFGGLFSNLARLAINRVFMRILDAVLPSSSGGSANSGIQLALGGNSQGGALGSIGNFIRQLVGGGSASTSAALTGGFAGGNPAAQLLGGAALGVGSAVSGFPVSFAQQAAQQGAIVSILHEAGHTAGAGVATGAASGAGLSTSLAALAPFLGAGLGAQLGGQSLLGQIVGGAGGLVAGGTLAALLAPTALTGLGLSGGLVGGIAAAAPFLLPAAAVALAASYFIGRSATRRRNEETRTQLSSEVYAATIQILNAARAGDLTEAQAIARFNDVRSNYFSSIAGFDSHTRRIATDWMNNDFAPFYEPLIHQGAQQGAANRARETAFIPTFASGGDVRAVAAAVRPFAGRVPGNYTGRDPFLIRVDGNEDVLVLNPAQRARLNLTPDSLSAAGVPGYAGGGAPNDGAMTSGGGQVGPLTVEVYISQGTEPITKVVGAVIRSAKGQQMIVGAVRAHVHQEREDGLAGDVIQIAAGR